MTTTRRTLAVALAIPALALAACGGGGDSDTIKDLIKDVDKDASVVCDHATDSLLQLLGGDPDKCKTTARGYANTSRIEGDITVKVDGDKASADFKGSDGKSHHVTLVKEDGDWKFATVG